MNLYRYLIIYVFAFTFFISGCKEAKSPEKSGPVPDARQLDWHDMKYYAFIHFSINTFTNKEWGDGAESPELFNPTQLDARQWAKVC
jgi:alpha-L-fucosidase